MGREEREPRKEPAMEGQTRAGGEDGQGERAARREVCAIPGGGQVHRAGLGQRVHPGGARARESQAGGGRGSNDIQEQECGPGELAVNWGAEEPQVQRS